MGKLDKVYSARALHDFQPKYFHEIESYDIAFDMRHVQTKDSQTYFQNLFIWYDQNDVFK